MLLLLVPLRTECGTDELLRTGHSARPPRKAESRDHDLDCPKNSTKLRTKERHTFVSRLGSRLLHMEETTMR